MLKSGEGGDEAGVTQWPQCQGPPPGLDVYSPPESPEVDISVVKDHGGLEPYLSRPRALPRPQLSKQST